MITSYMTDMVTIIKSVDRCDWGADLPKQAETCQALVVKATEKEAGEIWLKANNIQAGDVLIVRGVERVALDVERRTVFGETVVVVRVK